MSDKRGLPPATWFDTFTVLILNAFLFYSWASLYASEVWTGDNDEPSKKISKPPDDGADE